MNKKEKKLRAVHQRAIMKKVNEERKAIVVSDDTVAKS